jgi:segregation and condensation protein B
MGGEKSENNTINPDDDVIDSNSPDSENQKEQISSKDIFQAADTSEMDDATSPSSESENSAPSITATESEEDIHPESPGNSDDAENDGDTESATPVDTDTDAENDDEFRSDLNSSEDAGSDDDDDNVLLLENNEDETPDDILMSRIESLIFIYPEPITVRRMARHLSLTGKRVRALIEKLKTQYADRGINLSEISGGFQFHTNPLNADVIRTLTRTKPLRMSRPALETLAIVAYKQPCTRAEVEDVRRVDCGGTLKFLFEKELIRVLGRKEEPGRPIIYGTSGKFLEMFNLKSIADLPSLHEYTELWDEHKELVDEETGEDADKNDAAVAVDTDRISRQQEIPVDEHLDVKDSTPESNADTADDNTESSDLPSDDGEDGLTVEVDTGEKSVTDDLVPETDNEVPVAQNAEELPHTQTTGDEWPEDVEEEEEDEEEEEEE